jgi:hypothetical protein
MPIVKTCEVCGTEFKVPPTRAETARTCSNKCGWVVRGKSNQKRVEMSCVTCGKLFTSPECHASRRKTCSAQCREKIPEIAAAKAARIGELNANWNGGVYVHSEGYLLNRDISHPFAVGGYVMAHRLVMEQHMRLRDPGHEFLVPINGIRYLSQDIDVHHRNEVKTDNMVDNLVAMTPSAHKTLHNGAHPAIGSYWPDHGSLLLQTPASAGATL